MSFNWFLVPTFYVGMPSWTLLRPVVGWKREKGAKFNRAKSIVPVLLLSLLTGCAVGPDYVPPQTPLPDHWQESQAAANASEAAWWKTFHDPLLEKLIQQAASGNLDYRQALDRIGAARAQQTMAVAAGLPSLGARSSVNRRRNSFGGGGGSVGGTSSPTSFGGGGAGRNISNIFQAGFDAAWEIDVFGGIRRGVEAAEANWQAEQESSRDVLVSLLGEVARTYIDLRLAQRQTNITRANLADQDDVLQLTRARSQAGLASELDVAQAESVVSNTRAELPGHELATKQAVHALGVLLGKEPGALAEELAQPVDSHCALTPPGSLGEDRSESKSKPSMTACVGYSAIPSSSADAVADLPSELLRRRPDIRAAERKLASATAQIGVAAADQYPKFNLTALLGLQNPNLAQITPVGKSWAMGAAATMPLFNWGRIRANIKAKEAQRDELLHAYQAAVLNALRDVEDALAAHSEDRRRQQALAQSLQAAETSVQLSMERYRRGLTSFMDVLDAERSLFTAQSQLADSQAQVSADLVALYKALGGGWQGLDLHPAEP